MRLNTTATFCRTTSSLASCCFSSSARLAAASFSARNLAASRASRSSSAAYILDSAFERRATGASTTVGMYSPGCSNLADRGQENADLLAGKLLQGLGIENAARTASKSAATAASLQ